MPQFLFEGHRLDTERRELRRGSEQVMLEPQVFDLIAYLVKNRDRVLTKDDLFAAIWDGRIVSDSTLTSRINSARTALGDSGGEQRLIRTCARKGIRFVGEVQDGIAFPTARNASRVLTFGRAARQAVRRSTSVRQSQ